MIPRVFNEIVLTDVQQLVANAVPEGKTIEYKAALPGGSEADRKEFLADVSSFANTSGGDLLYGIEEQQGIASRVSGIVMADVDLEVRRLDNLIRDGIRPRIRHSIRAVEAPDGRRVLIIRVEHSWFGPHRVVFQGHDKFYGRTSAGKYPLDVEELRAAFTLSQSAVERVRAFRTDRIIALSDNETPIPFQAGGKLVLHCIPVDAFSGPKNYDVLQFQHRPELLPPLRTGGGWTSRITLDGFLSYTGNPVYSYTHAFRNGIIEAVDGTLINRIYEGERLIPSISYEQVPLQYLPRCFQLLQMLGVNPPIAVALTLTNVRGATLSHEAFDLRAYYPIDTDTLILPEVVVEDYNQSAAAILKPAFDLVWNACGQSRSLNFDNQGNWITRR